MQKILILSESCCWKFKQIAKIEFGTKKSVESSMHSLTLGPTAQATLILLMFGSIPNIFRVSALYHGYGFSSVGAGSPKVFVQ